MNIDIRGKKRVVIGKVGLIDAVPRQDERSLLAVGRCRVLGEEVATIEALDRFNPLEELG